MQFYRVIRIVYIKSQVIGKKDIWAGRILELLSEVISEPKNWTDGYEDYRKAVWALKKSRIKLPKDMGMEIILQGYCTSKGSKTDPFSEEAVSDRIVNEREWVLPTKGDFNACR